MISKRTCFKKSPLAHSLNPRTNKGAGGGGEVLFPVRFFFDFFLDDFLPAPAVFSSCTLIHQIKNAAGDDDDN